MILPPAQIYEGGTGFIPQINQWVFALRFYKEYAILTNQISKATFGKPVVSEANYLEQPEKVKMLENKE